MFNLEFWLILALILIILELNTTTFYLLCIAIASLSAATVSYLGYDIEMQIVVFVIMAIVCIILSRPLSSKIKNKSSNSKYNTERLIGRKGVVTENIDKNHVGKVSVNDEIWLAVSEETLEINDKVKVIDINSTKLVVEKIN